MSTVYSIGLNAIHTTRHALAVKVDDTGSLIVIDFRPFDIDDPISKSAEFKLIVDRYLLRRRVKLDLPRHQ